MRPSAFSSVASTALLLLITACGGEPTTAPTTTRRTTTSAGTAVEDAGSRAEALCRTAVKERSETISDPELSEISGVVASPDHHGVLWVHDDSGTANLIWALDSDGRVLSRRIVRDAESVDWEDVARRVDRARQQSYLYLADIGDNAFTPVIGRKLEPRTAENPATIYRVEEPDVARDRQTTEPATAFAVAYADGPRDAEAMIVDPLSGDAFVISKQWDGSAAGLYRLPATVIGAAHAPSEVTTMQRVADVARTGHDLVTGADISLDGTLVALRTYDDVRLWRRDPHQSLAETLDHPPSCIRPFPQPQGESVAITDKGRTLVMISEGDEVPIDRLRLPSDRTAPDHYRRHETN